MTATSNHRRPRCAPLRRALTLSAATLSLVTGLGALSAGCAGGPTVAHDHYLAGRYHHAIHSYEAVYSSHREDPLVNARLGTAWHRLGAYETAEIYLRRALNAGNTDLGTEWLLAECMARRGLYRAAADAYRRLTGRRPGDPLLWNNLGMMHLHLAEVWQAQTAFERALGLDPEHPAALVNLGLLHDRHLDQPLRAAEFFETYRRVAPGGARLAEVEAWLVRYHQLRATSASASPVHQASENHP